MQVGKSKVYDSVLRLDGKPLHQTCIDSRDRSHEACPPLKSGPILLLELCAHCCSIRWSLTNIGDLLPETIALVVLDRARGLRKEHRDRPLVVNSLAE